MREGGCKTFQTVRIRGNGQGDVDLGARDLGDKTGEDGRMGFW